MTDALFPAGAALVVGGSGGIGSFVALELARAGSDVALTYRSNKAKAEEVAGQIRALGRQASVHGVDVADAGAVARMAEEAAAAHGRLHTVVYGAAPLTDQYYVSQIPVARWNEAIEQEVSGFFRVVHATLPRLKAWGGGSYVHMGSAADRLWANKDGLSVIPKAANEALIRGLAKEEGRNNIRANSVLIGVIEAGMFLELTRQGVFDERWVEASQKLLCLKRWGRPEEIGHAVVFLASSRAAYVTGQQISVSGGLGV
jgi:NAD(P)-dependent dehydrogenase (short-subunit alcohol dehydrogenase family)